jgi:HSP20 family molecular chaperone IbpA
LSWKISVKFDLSKLEAKLDKGLLVLDIPYAESKKPKQIVIK